jgi:hypothetical protein
LTRVVARRHTRCGSRRVTLKALPSLPAIPCAAQPGDGGWPPMRGGSVFRLLAGGRRGARARGKHKFRAARGVWCFGRSSSLRAVVCVLALGFPHFFCFFRGSSLCVGVLVSKRTLLSLSISLALRQPLSLLSLGFQLVLASSTIPSGKEPRYFLSIHCLGPLLFSRVEVNF